MVIKCLISRYKQFNLLLVKIIQTVLRQTDRQTDKQRSQQTIATLYKNQLYLQGLQM